MSGRYILIVDDNPSDRAIAKAVAERNQFLVSEAEDAYRAFEALGDEDFRYSLLVIDLQMPRIPGLDLLKRVRRMEVYQKVPVLIMSGRNRAIDIQAAISMGANDYIVKPMDLTILDEKIKRLTTQESSQWAEYQVPAERGHCEVSHLGRIASLNELGAEVVLPFELPTGRPLTLGIEVLSERGVPAKLMKVESVRRTPEGFAHRVMFVGLTEAQRKIIRVLCRQLHAETQSQRSE
jgi:two-component system chemotaxis response regulator CheY